MGQTCSRRSWRIFCRLCFCVGLRAPSTQATSAAGGAGETRFKHLLSIIKVRPVLLVC